MRDEELLKKSQNLKDKGYPNTQIGDRLGFHESTIRRILGERDRLFLRDDEVELSYEELSERWNERSAMMGKPEHRWAVVDGEFVKVNWPDKDPESPNYHYDLVDGKLYYPLNRD